MGISRSASHTRRWKTVPRRSSGRSKPVRGSLDEADHPGDEILKLAIFGNQLRFRKSLREIVGQRGWIVAQEDRADALLRAATRIDPSEHLPTAKRIAAPLPPLR